MVRHRFLLHLCTVLCIGLYAGPGSALSDPKSPQQTLRVVTDNNYPPYAVIGLDGQPEGYTVDLWRLWERKTGVRVDFKAIQWSEAQKSMQDGRADAIDLIFRTPVREQLYDYSEPHATLPVNIYVDASIQGVRSPTDLLGFTIGVQRGDACIDELARLGITSLAAYPNYQGILGAAQAGDIKIFCMDEAPASYYLYLHRDKLRFSQAFKLYEGQFHWAVNKGDKATLALINRGMAMITAKEREALQQKWFSQPFEFRPYLRMLAGASMVLMLAFAAAAAWIWTLRRSVQSRTAEIRQANQQLKAERAMLRTIVDKSPDGIALKSRDGVYLDCNAGTEMRLGLTREAIIGKTDEQLFADQQLAAEIHRTDLEVMRTGQALKYEQRLGLNNGEMRDLEVVKVPVNDEQQQVAGVLVVVRDITERLLAEHELRIASVAFQSHNGLMIVSALGVIERVNGAFTVITGYPPEEAIGKTPRILRSGLHPPDFYQAMWAAVLRDGRWHGEVVNRRRDGTLSTARLSITAVTDQQGSTAHFIGDLQDISAEKQAREEAERLKLYDPLTALPNRRLLEDRMRLATKLSEDRGEYGTLIMLDVDHFRHINDSLGHGFGDHLLAEIAKRIVAVSGEGETLARFSGDAFVLLKESLGSDQQLAARQALALADAVRLAIAAPYNLDGHKIVATGSFGVTMFLGTQVATDVLLRQAELAMYKSKNGGHNLVSFFEESMQQEIDRHRWLEQELREALAQEQFTMHYQLQVDAAQQPCGAEALIRWNHPVRGVVSPAEFISLAEETGLIEPMGHWALSTVCDQLARWAQDEVFCHMTLSVNVSPRQFKSDTFVGEVIAQVQRSGAPIGRLKLEVTESVAIDSFDDSIAKLQALRELGCLISLDDFGTGNSSLNYLTRLPLSQLKIDKSFVDNLPQSSADSMVAQAIIAMGHGLGLDVIAEGVETAEQKVCLEGMGCRLFQGYLFGRPVPSKALEQSVRDLLSRRSVA